MAETPQAEMVQAAAVPVVERVPAATPVKQEAGPPAEVILPEVVGVEKPEVEVEEVPMAPRQPLAREEQTAENVALLVPHKVGMEVAERVYLVPPTLPAATPACLRYLPVQVEEEVAPELE